jgi:hypothetical protein
MRYSDEDLRAAAAAGVIGTADLERLTAFLSKRPSETEGTTRATFDVANLFWYAGALIVIGAMGLFSTLAFSQMGGRALTGTAAVYALAFTLAGHHLWYRKKLQVPGGLLIAIAVSMAPLAVYGIQDELGLWGHFGKPGSTRDFYIWIKGSWIFMEIAAVAAGVLALCFYRFSFIVAIIAVALWFMSMDLAPWIIDATHTSDWDMRRQVSLWFGLGVLMIAWIVDCRMRGGDFAFWLHLFGLMAFWGAVSSTDGSGELGKALYCLLNVGLLLMAVLLMRRVYAVFGTLGISFYLGHLADAVFKDSLLFPFALSLIGVAVIGFGLLYHRHQGAMAAWVAAHLPDPVKRLRPLHAR